MDVAGRRLGTCTFSLLPVGGDFRVVERRAVERLFQHQPSEDRRRPIEKLGIELVKVASPLRFMKRGDVFMQTAYKGRFRAAQDSNKNSGGALKQIGAILE